MQKMLLIDGDIVAYRFSAQTESACEWTPGEMTYSGNVEEAVRKAKEWVEALQIKLNADSFLVCFSDPSRRYFRHDLWPEYKQHRTQGRPPVHRGEVVAALKEILPSKTRPNLEADDTLGILATWDGFCASCDKIIVSLDKDMRTIPGSHFNYEQDTDVRFVSEAEADIYHMTQTLTGDSCDGFKGCPGIGPVKARKILNATDGTPAEMWKAVATAYLSKGLTVDDAVREARMARILRSSDFDFNTMRPIPWTPPVIEEHAPM
jgi:5'-3' exonuclease